MNATQFKLNAIQHSYFALPWFPRPGQSRQAAGWKTMLLLQLKSYSNGDSCRPGSYGGRAIGWMCRLRAPLLVLKLVQQAAALSS